ncbi:MAG TPA: pseudouridine synthase [Desulfobacteria bacterium]|nr:pseudouridine synthase [Desulfobacteria bacterium]
MEERLQKTLAQAGVASRRHAEELILAGKVSVNGRKVTELGTKVNPYSDEIRVEGKKIAKRENKVYLLLNKPAGYVSTVRDPQGRRTVVDLVKGIKERVYPVGRLDYETEGLLLMTNDGDFAYALTHPKHQVEKTYLALVVGVPQFDQIKTLRRGIRLADGLTAPAKVNRVSVIEGNALLEIKIHEGRNRQVRRMCEAIGHPVMKLHRTALAGLGLEEVPLGAYRHLSGEEVAELFRLAGPQTGQRQTGRPQTGRPQTGRAQTGRPQTGRAQTGRTQTVSAQTGRAQTGRAQTASAQTGRPQTGRPQTGRSQTVRSSKGRSEQGVSGGRRAPEQGTKNSPKNSPNGRKKSQLRENR